MTLLLLLACADLLKDARVIEAPDPNGDSGDTAVDSRPPDADGDGADATVDCDDADPGRAPGIPEVCDGIDQDCDGEADDGVPNDGAGCQDPGAPAFPDPVTSLQVTLTTGTGTTDGSDDSLYVCVGADLCWGLDLVDWDDREPGITDVHAIEGLSIPRASLDRFELRTSSGDDRWVPARLLLAADGEPVYCQDPDGVWIGNTSSEFDDWTDPEGLGDHCATAAALTLGPMLGSIEPDGARLWYRTDATREVRLRVAASESALATAAVVHYGWPRPEHDFTDEVRVYGLSPESTWFYDLEIGGVRYGPWSFTTAPASGTSGRRRFAFGSCTKEDDQPAFGVVLAYDPDVYVFIGDNHYGNTPDLGSLRQYYRWAHARPLRSSLLAQASILATWDDHDFVGNNTDGSADGKDEALRAFDEYWANPGVGAEGIAGVFSRYSWGDIDVFLIDDRYWRGLEDSITGDAQEAWLVEAVTTSTATFKLVGSGSQWTAYGSSDSWAAFPEARSRVIDALTTVPGVVLLSGDVHRSEFRLLDDAAGYPLPEITSSAMAYTPNAVCPDDPDVLACYDSGHSFVTLEVDTTAADPSLYAVVVDEDGAPQLDWTITLSQITP